MPESHALFSSSFNAWSIFGRLLHGVSAHQASERLHALWPQLVSSVGQHPDKDEDIAVLRANKGISELRDNYSRALLLLLAIVFAVLVIACLNVANVLLAQATARQREFAVRLAIGANRWQVARQLILESLFLAVGGTILGLALAYSIGPLTVSLLSTWRDPVVVAVQPDRTILLAAATLSLLITILIGVLPALKSFYISEEMALSAGSRMTITQSQRAVSKGLIVVEIAIAFVLSTTGVLFLKSLHNLYQSEGGLRNRQLVVLRVEGGRLPLDKKRLLRIVEAVREESTRDPDVKSLAFSMFSPFMGGNMTDRVLLGGDKATGVSERLQCFVNKTTPSFAPLFGTRILAGRNFTEQDETRSSVPVLINEEFARTVFHNMNPVGRQISLVYMEGPYEIVGVISNLSYKSFRAKPTSQIYFPLSADTKGPVLLTIALEIRSKRESGTIMRLISNVVSQVDSEAFVASAELQQLIDDSMRQDKLLTTVSSLLGGIAIGLAIIGIYGLLLYNVSRRVPEIGIRITVGATKWSIQWLVVKEALLLIALGLSLGIPAFVMLSTQMQGMLVEVSVFDFASIVQPALTLIIVGVIAASIPAYRASAIDPQVALRYE